jgi:hypothetical protein
MANSVNITGSDFSQLNNALDQVAKRSAQSVRFMSRMFNTDYSSGKTFTGLDRLCNKIKEVNLEAIALNNTLRSVGSVGIRPPSAASARAYISGGAGGAGGGKKTGGDAGGDEDFELKAMTKYRRSFIKFEKREADFLAKQRENSANETYKRIVAKSKEEEKLKQKLAADAKKKEDLELRLQKKSASKIDVPELGLYKKAGSFSDKIAKTTAKTAASDAKRIEKLKGQEGSDLFVGPLSPSSAQKRDIKNAEKALIADERARIAEKLKLEREIRQLDKQTAKENAQEAKKAQAQAAMMRANQAQSIAFDRKMRALQAGEMGGLSATRNAIRRAEANAAATKSRLGLSGMGLLGPMAKGQMFNFMNERALERAFNFKSRIASYGSNAGSMVSKFGNPGQMPLFSRFRVFQRPFPGSERNPFSLGDTGNIANNAIFGISSGVRKAFETITTAGTDVVRAFSGVAQAGMSVGAKLLTSFSSMLSNIPTVGAQVASAIFGAFGTVLAGLGQIVGVVTDAFTNLLDALSKVIGETITALGTVALGLAGFAHRAVVAASTLTELKNAAAIYVGASGAKAMTATAVEYQQNYGLSASDSLKLMTRFAGQIRQTTGVGSDQAAKEAQAIFKAAADAGSVLNMDLADIGNIAQSAMAGRYTPLRRMGVTVSADYLDTVAKQQGFDKDAKTPFAARTKALEYEILRQTKGFTGDLAATQYEFANQQRKLLGIFEAAFVHVGRALEPFARVIMIASTTVGSIFVKQLEAFGDWVQSSFQDMVDFKDGGKLQVYLAAVTKAAARAADYLLYFADKLYENKDVIYEFIRKIGEVLYSLALDLMRFSLTMITVMAGFFKILPNVLDSLKLFGEVLAAFAKEIDKRMGLGIAPDAKAKAVREAVELKGGVDGRQGWVEWKRLNDEANTGKNWLGQDLAPAERKSSQDKADKLRDRLTEMEARKREFLALTRGGMGVDEATEKVYGNKDNPWAGNMAAGLEKLGKKGKDALDALEKNGLGGVLPNVPGRVNPEDIIDWMLMAPGARPDFGDPEPFKGKGGRLSQYFDPAAYRDEVQSREMTAAQQTAENTGEMLQELKVMNAANNAARPALGVVAVTTV